MMVVEPSMDVHFLMAMKSRHIYRIMEIPFIQIPEPVLTIVGNI